MSKLLKGGTFQSRCVFKAQITALSPLHIGSGNMIERPGMVDDKNKLLQISGVVVDGNNKPYIPGSSMRGAMRDWLRKVWGEQDREDKKINTLLKTLIKEIKDTNNELEKNSEETAKIITDKEERLEILFGSVFAEGKIEIWDATCVSDINTARYPTDSNWSGWDIDRLTYVAKSVAINPETGTAEDKKLYNFELVPEGACFNITLTGQNLTDEDVALILHALDGFKHPTFPLVLGSMTKQGFGRFSINNLTVYRLTNDKIDKWKELCANDNLAGYDSICRNDFKLSEYDITSFKNKVVSASNGQMKLMTKWTFTLETPLVVRSGSKFGWKNTKKSKTRNYQIQYKWGEKTLDEIADLYFSLKINGDKVELYYHIPSSSIRGSLREWTVKHLLPEQWWDVENELKEYAKKEEEHRLPLPTYLTNIKSLFGFVVKTGDGAIDKKYTCAGRLTIDTSPFEGTYSKPDVDVVENHGWQEEGNKYGPTNAKRHIKTRNPLDRITNAAKEGGLHSGLEFSKGQSFTVTLTVENPTDFDEKLFDEKLIDWWRKEINDGMIRFGGLSSIGRGRVSVQEVKDVKE